MQYRSMRQIIACDIGIKSQRQSVSPVRACQSTLFHVVLFLKLQTAGIVITIFPIRQLIAQSAVIGNGTASFQPFLDFVPHFRITVDKFLIAQSLTSSVALINTLHAQGAHLIDNTRTNTHCVNKNRGSHYWTSKERGVVQQKGQVRKGM